MENFGPNMVNFLLMLGARRWYIIRAFVLLNNMPAMHWVEQVLVEKPEGAETIFLEDLNVRLGEPCNKHK